MKRLLLLLALAGAALLAGGHVVGAFLIAAALALLVVGIVRIDSGILARARTRVPEGIALTYDDGPDPHSTPPLLDLLKEHGARATFFVIGEKARAHPDLVRRCAEEGHTIANHSHRHGTWTNLHFGGWMRRELAACQRAVEEAAGTTPRHYRPPFGLLNPSVEPAARSLGLEIVGWSIRSFDTVRTDAEARVIARLAAGAIVLLHDGGLDPDRVVATTRTILEAAAARGLEAVAL